MTICCFGTIELLCFLPSGSEREVFFILDLLVYIFDCHVAGWASSGDTSETVHGGSWNKKHVSVIEYKYSTLLTIVSCWNGRWLSENLLLDTCWWYQEEKPQLVFILDNGSYLISPEWGFNCNIHNALCMFFLLSFSFFPRWVMYSSKQFWFWGCGVGPYLMLWNLYLTKLMWFLFNSRKMYRFLFYSSRRPVPIRRV